MKYEKDSANNQYLEIPFGWGSEKAKLRLTINKEMETVRICKKDESG